MLKQNRIIKGSVAQLNQMLKLKNDVSKFSRQGMSIVYGQSTGSQLLKSKQSSTDDLLYGSKSTTGYHSPDRSAAQHATRSVESIKPPLMQTLEQPPHVQVDVDLQHPSATGSKEVSTQRHQAEDSLDQRELEALQSRYGLLGKDKEEELQLNVGNGLNGFASHKLSNLKARKVKRLDNRTSRGGGFVFPKAGGTDSPAKHMNTNTNTSRNSLITIREPSRFSVDGSKEKQMIAEKADSPSASSAAGSRAAPVNVVLDCPEPTPDCKDERPTLYMICMSAE